VNISFSIVFYLVNNLSIILTKGNIFPIQFIIKK
jgi:hypothetical protein